MIDIICTYWVSGQTLLPKVSADQQKGLGATRRPSGGDSVDQTHNHGAAGPAAATWTGVLPQVDLPSGATWTGVLPQVDLPSGATWTGVLHQVDLPQ